MTGIILQLSGVLLLNLYALALVLLRAPVFRTRLYKPMVLNIGLSLAPAVVLLLVLTSLLLITVAAPSAAAIWITIIVGTVVWVLLLPNAAYLITELNFSHRREDDSVPLWYDIVLVLALALSGLLNTLLSVVFAQTIYTLVAYPNDAHPLARPDAWALIVIVLLLVSIGIYLGRYIRFNSWDILHPASFIRKLRRHFRRPGTVREALAFCLVHTILLLVLYLVVLAPGAGLL